MSALRAPVANRCGTGIRRKGISARPEHVSPSGGSAFAINIIAVILLEHGLKTTEIMETI